MPCISGSRLSTRSIGALATAGVLVACLVCANTAQAAEVRGRVPWPTSTAPAVVWIEGTKVSAAIIRQPVVIRQKNMQFVPPFTVVSRGQTVQFPNDDSVAHSVFSVSPARPFQLGVFEEGSRRSVIADRVGVIDVKCALHAQMRATLFVVDSAHHAVAQANGTFAIQNVPPGKHRIKAWNGDGRIIETPIDVAGNGSTVVSFQPSAIAGN